MKTLPWLSLNFNLPTSASSVAEITDVSHQCAVGVTQAVKQENVKCHKNNRLRQPGIVVHACNPSTQWLWQENKGVEARLGYIPKHYLNKETNKIFVSSNNRPH
jgi:hypothetical protein